MAKSNVAAVLFILGSVLFCVSVVIGNVLLCIECFSNREDLVGSLSARTSTTSQLDDVPSRGSSHLSSSSCGYQLQHTDSHDSCHDAVFSHLVVVKSRLVPALTVALTKIFLGGACWQAFGFLADSVFPSGQHTHPPFATTAPFVLFTGIGDAVGVVAGHTILTVFNTSRKECVGGCCTAHSLRIAGALALGSALSGGAWQVAVDVCVDHTLSFTTAMVATGLCCGFLFWFGFTIGQEALGLSRATLQDLTLGLACVGSSAFFVGTDMRYHGNWSVSRGFIQKKYKLPS